MCKLEATKINSKSKCRHGYININTGGEKIEDWLYKRICNAIWENRLKPSTEISQAYVAKLLNVKRAPICNVFMKLALDHIVELRPNQSALIKSTTYKEAIDIFEARRVVESEIIEITIERYTSNDLELIKSVIKAGQKALKSQNIHVLVFLIAKLHLIFADICGNSILKKYIEVLMLRTYLIAGLYDTPGMLSHINYEQTRLARSIEKRNCSEAIEILFSLIHGMEERLYLQNYEPSMDISEILSMREADVLTLFGP